MFFHRSQRWSRSIPSSARLPTHLADAQFRILFQALNMLQRALMASAAQKAGQRPLQPKSAPSAKTKQMLNIAVDPPVRKQTHQVQRGIILYRVLHSSASTGFAPSSPLRTARSIWQS